jgi:hypothetical protein
MRRSHWWVVLVIPVLAGLAGLAQAQGPGNGNGGGSPGGGKPGGGETTAGNNLSFPAVGALGRPTKLPSGPMSTIPHTRLSTLPARG